MTIDILFPTFNRLEFTRQALAALLANTNWDLVSITHLWDDGSTDGTYNLLREFEQRCPSAFVTCTSHKSPAAAMNAFVQRVPRPQLFAKIDSDTIVPPGWLDRCAAIMEAHPELDLLGIEPPASRTPHYEGGKRSAAPELDGPTRWRCTGKISEDFMAEVAGYAPCDSIGGIGLMRTRCFLENEPLAPTCTYSGFTSWQISHPKITKGWCVPPLDVFLLDRLPSDPWAKLSSKYEAKGYQRPWSKYPRDSKLWEWWRPV